MRQHSVSAVIRQSTPPLVAVVAVTSTRRPLAVAAQLFGDVLAEKFLVGGCFSELAEIPPPGEVSGRRCRPKAKPIQRPMGRPHIFDRCACWIAPGMLMIAELGMSTMCSPSGVQLRMEMFSVQCSSTISSKKSNQITPAQLRRQHLHQEVIGIITHVNTFGVQIMQLVNIGGSILRPRIGSGGHRCNFNNRSL